jgi:hypothetical protein
MPDTSAGLTLGGLYETARRALNREDVTLDFSRDIIHKMACPRCGGEEEVFAPVGAVGIPRARCPKDGATRAVTAIHSFTGAESYGDRKLNELGLPLWDVYVARAGAAEMAFLIAGDARSVVGPLATDAGASV